MATPNIVPRADSEGGLGTASKYWASAYIDTITTTGDIISSGSSKSIKTFRRWYMDGNADFGINNASGSSVLLISGGGTPSTSTATFTGNVLVGATSFADTSWASNIVKVQGSRATLSLYSTGSLSSIAMTASSSASNAIHLNQDGTDGGLKIYQYSASGQTLTLAGSGYLGVGTAGTTPATLLSNTGTRIGNADGLTTHLSGLNWAVNGQGYTAALSNLSTTGSAHNGGLLVEIASTDATDKILDLESGGVNRFRMLGTGAATFAGNITVGGGQILTPGGINLALNPNTGVVSVGGYILQTGSAALTLSLDSTHANGGYLRMLESGAAKFYIGKGSSISGTSGGYDIYTTSGNDLRFFTGGTNLALTLDTSQDATFTGDVVLESGTSGTTNKIIFKTTDNSDLSKFVRTNAYWNEYGGHANEGHKFIDSNGNTLLKLNGGNSASGNGTLSSTFAGNISTAAAKRISIGTWDNSAFTGGAAQGYFAEGTTPMLILEETDVSKTGYAGLSGGNMYIGGIITNLIFQTNNGTNALTLDSSQDATFTGDVTINKDAAKLILQDTGTGNALNQWVSYRDSAGTERGYVGYGSTGNSVFYIQNTLSEIHFHTSSGLCQTLSGTNTTFAGNITTNSGPIRFNHQQNAASRLELYNNRQDLSNVEVYRIAAYNSVEVAGVHFYRGGGGNSGYTKIFAKKNNASSLEEVVRFGQDNALTTTFAGDVTIGTTSDTVDRYIKILSGDTKQASLEAYGDSQGTGVVYVGQSSTYGGGIVYNGDGSPAFGNVTTDTISFYRREAGTDYEVFRYGYGGSDVTFTGAIFLDGFTNPTTQYLSFRDAFVPSASGGIGLMALDHSGSSNDGLALYGHDGMSFYTAQVERMRITSAGDIEIPTDSAKLKFRGSGSSDYSSISRDASNVIQIANTAGSNIVSIDNGGNVGIGTSVPYNLLQVYQTGNVGNNYVEGAIQVGGTSAALGGMFSYSATGSGRLNISSLNNAGGNAALIHLGFGVSTSGNVANTVMTLTQAGKVGIGTMDPTALLSMKEAAYVQEWDYAKGYYHHTTATGSAAGDFDISTVINTHNLRGLTVDYYESGHYYNNGGAYYFRHSRVYILIESSTLRVGDVELIKSTGNTPSAIVAAPTVTASGTNEATIVSTILSGYTHYLSVDVVGSGFESFESIS